MALVGTAKLVSKETIPQYRWRWYGFAYRYQQRRDDVVYTYSARSTAVTDTLTVSVSATLENRIVAEIDPAHFEVTETYRHKGVWVTQATS
jgi:hypothetical protein